MTLEEAELLLAAAAREGSVSALKLWFDRNVEPSATVVAVDPFKMFDELAAAREKRQAAS